MYTFESLLGRQVSYYPGSIVKVQTRMYLRSLKEENRGFNSLYKLSRKAQPLSMVTSSRTLLSQPSTSHPFDTINNHQPCRLTRAFITITIIPQPRMPHIYPLRNPNNIPFSRQRHSTHPATPLPLPSLLVSKSLQLQLIIEGSTASLYIRTNAISSARILQRYRSLRQ